MSRTCRRTLSELRAMATKAARGAGCEWGVADEAGLAVRALESRGLPGAASLAQLFDSPRRCACHDSAASAACALRLLTDLLDAPPDRSAVLGRVAAPLILAVALVDHKQGVRLDWGSGSVTCGLGAINGAGDMLPTDAPEVVMQMGVLPDAGAPPSHASQEVSAAAFAQLDALAARTYVPETDASRARGAGDGAR